MSHYSGKDLPPHYQIPLDDSHYNLRAEEIAFFKDQTGIEDDAQLKEHILDIQAKAYSIYPYPCIRRLSWTKLKISRLFPYRDFLKLGEEREGAIFLDMGCCFGNDLRKAVADGYPLQNTVASDLHSEFWDLGHKLFKTTPESFPVPFITGDAFQSTHLEIAPPFTAASPPTTPRPALATLTSLNPLRGHVSAIHASSFFHLFKEQDQLYLARALAGLLAPDSGSMIFGQHVCMPVKGNRDDGSAEPGKMMFCHSPESWKEIWDGDVFEKGTVKVETEEGLTDSEARPGGGSFRLSWCVTRL